MRAAVNYGYHAIDRSTRAIGSNAVVSEYLGRLRAREIRCRYSRRIRDGINRPGGIGKCGANANSRRTRYPHGAVKVPAPHRTRFMPAIGSGDAVNTRDL